MGRYTTVQTFTDQDTKAAISYSAATSSSSGSGAKASHYGPGDAATTNSSSSASGHGESRAAAINRVDNVSGSSAGAGSGDFHMYRASRRRFVPHEQHRVLVPVCQSVSSRLVTYEIWCCVCVAALLALL